MEGSTRRAVACSLLLDYRAYGILALTSLVQWGRGGAIHPHTSRATISAYFFPLVFPYRGHAHATSRPVSRVCSTQFILSSCIHLLFVCFISLSPLPPLNLDCDWKSLPCDFPASCPVRTFFISFFLPSPRRPSTYLHYPPRE
jgi:hypothetical protein